MIKKRVLFIFTNLIFLVLLVNLVSAGLCKGSDGYYHDCNDFGNKYYKKNFYPNYKYEYYKENSASSSSILSIKEDRHSYEEIKADSYAESNIEITKKERDYSYPKKIFYKNKFKDYRYYDKGDYEDDYWGKRDYYDYDKKKNRYEWDDEPHLIVFVNKVEPIHYRRRANGDSRRERDSVGGEGELSLNWPYN